MHNNLSPDNIHHLTFKPNGEVGMGGPSIGSITINGNTLGQDFMNSWIWSQNSESILMLEFLGRAPDRTRVVTYNISTGHLKHHKHELGFSLTNVEFDGLTLVLLGDCSSPPINV